MGGDVTTIPSTTPLTNPRSRQGDGSTQTDTIASIAHAEMQTYHDNSEEPSLPAGAEPVQRQTNAS
eukprot:7263907-Lingulodinium_polyedra.AAC.1